MGSPHIHFRFGWAGTGEALPRCVEGRAEFRVEFCSQFLHTLLLIRPALLPPRPAPQETRRSRQLDSSLPKDTALTHPFTSVFPIYCAPTSCQALSQVLEAPVANKSSARALPKGFIAYRYNVMNCSVGVYKGCGCEEQGLQT